MPTNRSACPSRPLLEQLARLEIPADEADPLYDHIEACPACQGVFTAITEERENTTSPTAKAITTADLDHARAAMES